MFIAGEERGSTNYVCKRRSAHDVTRASLGKFGQECH